MNPFDYVNAINSRKDIMSNTDNDELAEKGYNPYLTNRQFSYFEDTVHYANVMNMYSHLESKLQFSFLINMIRPKRRFAKWAKTEHHDDLEAVVEYYGYSYDKAKQIMDILSSQQIKDIKEKLEKGGLKK
tara:strand:+ start:1888 stop:2277 length:390 start_codon:yes stop_codon:yes gene_type:complete